MIGKKLGTRGACRVQAGAVRRANDRRRAMATAARARAIRAGMEGGKATYHVNFDYVKTMSVDVEASNVEEAVKKAWERVPGDLEVCEVWCNSKTGKDGKWVDFGGFSGKDGEKAYQEGSWFTVDPI